MIIERATLTIQPGGEADFEAAFAQARRVVGQADGFQSLRIARGIESPSTYLLLIEWDTVEAHMIGFRESDRFVRWRELIGPYFAAPPAVEHFEPID
ncbi:MAG: antibiotic biosynthesis monooxygenase [Solirubrobacterales bacterium]